MFIFESASMIVYIPIFLIFILLAWLAVMMDKRIVRLKKEIENIKQQLKSDNN